MFIHLSIRTAGYHYQDIRTVQIERFSYVAGTELTNVSRICSKFHFFSLSVRRILGSIQLFAYHERVVAGFFHLEFYVRYILLSAFRQAVYETIKTTL